MRALKIMCLQGKSLRKKLANKAINPSKRRNNYLMIRRGSS
jgi:hypothetical protein